MSLLVLTEDELRQIVTIAEAIDAVEAAFVALAESRMHVPGNFTLDLPEVSGQVDVEGAYLSQAPYYVVRINSNFRNNSRLELPIQGGLTAVFDAANGSPVAIMLDNGYLTHLRAGAAGALAARYLANQTLDRVVVLGSGSQAYIQLKSLTAVRHVGLVSVWGRSPLHVDSYARRLVEDHDLNIEIAPSLETAVRQADLIITATSSQQPLLQADWLKPGVHITAVGSNHPNKQELDVAVLQRADVIIADKLDQCAAAGEIHHAMAAGVITLEHVQGELGELITGKIPGRTDPGQITVADLTGLEVQNTAIATLALEKALFLGLGQRVESQL
ncbi:MAG: ornithine cyclodeaminase family protein [Anaerolineales bacterium]|nr:ornithine cyclodeaminase family protein [Anaerolineales bacterium]